MFRVNRVLISSYTLPNYIASKRTFLSASVLVRAASSNILFVSGITLVLAGLITVIGGATQVGMHLAHTEIVYHNLGILIRTALEHNCNFMFDVTQLSDRQLADAATISALYGYDINDTVKLAYYLHSTGNYGVMSEYVQRDLLVNLFNVNLEYFVSDDFSILLRDVLLKYNISLDIVDPGEVLRIRLAHTEKVLSLFP